MKLLALDTSSTACSVALLANNQINTRHVIAPMQQAQLILPMINELLSETGVELHQLDALAFGCGPGSFTGVRIAASVIQGLAFASNLPVISISSLAALAQAAYTDLGWKKLIVAIDARIQEIYWGMYQVNSQGLVELMGTEKVDAPHAITLANIQPTIQEWHGIGSAWQVYADQLPNNLEAIDPTRLPMASAILLLAQQKYAAGDLLTAATAWPVYLRDEVAIKEKKR